MPIVFKNYFSYYCKEPVCDIRAGICGEACTLTDFKCFCENACKGHDFLGVEGYLHQGGWLNELRS